MGDLKSKIIALLGGISGVSVGYPLTAPDILPDYKRTTPSRNGGTPSGAAASKRAAAKRRNVRARSSRK